MSRFTGKQYPGALKDLRAQRRLEAEQRNTTHQALNPSGPQRPDLELVVAFDGTRDGQIYLASELVAPKRPGAATRLLNAIFGNPTDREVQP